MNKRKVLSLFLALSLCVGMLTVPASAAGEFPYSDVPADAWYAEAVRYAHESGIMNGTGEGIFSPDATTTRATVVTLLHRAEKTPETTGEAFTDVPADAWYAKAVAWASANKIVNGTGGGLFSPDAVITREQFATILYRYASFKGVDVSKVADLSKFPDAASVSDFAKTAVAWAVKVGLISGTNLGTLDPLGGATRAQAATILMRYEKNVAATPAPTPTPTATPKPSRRPSSGGGGSSYTPSYSNLTVAESKTVDETKTYQNVTITDAVGDGTVTLANMTILGNLYINGGGAHTVNLTNVTIKGKIIMAKVGGETPRLNLVNTPVNTVEVEQPATIQADAASTVAAVQARASVYAIGSDTVITAVTVPAGVKEKVYVVANDTAVVEVVNAKSEAAVTGATNAVKEVVAEAPVTVAADAVKKVEVPATAPENVTVAVTGAGSVEVAVNSEKGAAITTEADEEGNKANVEVSTKLDTPPTVTVDGEEKHIHQWGEWVKVDDATHKRVCKADETHVETAAHTLGKWVKVDETSHKNTCSVCGGEVTAAHTVVIDPAVAADCLNPGKTEGKHCSDCNAVLTAQEVVAALGHDFTGAYLTDAEGHWHKCTRCDKTDEKAAHTYPDGVSCDSATNCTVCNYEKPAGQHTWDAGKVTIAPTCTEKGVKTFTCTVCKQAKTEDVDALGHDWGEWVKEDDTNHKRVCKRDAAHTETEAHAWDDGVVTTEPTEDKEGVKTYTCATCKGTKTEAVPVVDANKISNVHFEAYSGIDFLNCIAWDGPAPTGGTANDKRYIIKVTKDGGTTWEQLTIVSRETKYALFSDYDQDQAFNGIKVILMDGSTEVDSAEALDLKLNVTVTQNQTPVTAEIAFDTDDSSKINVSLTGLTEPSWFYFHTTVDTSQVSGAPYYGCEAQFKTTPRFTTLEEGKYIVREYVNSAISEDGKTASYTILTSEWTAIKAN